ncbi:selenoprotein N [Mytilus galloprovincialis]|uniref:Selenoprotein N n=1 Tax=Mytilus galloprovincialis TaxID=29158 RepID=A0A8B6EAG9_MYTGA|nr:selenoprotein N [Mytilus galloprovincialis]
MPSPPDKGGTGENEVRRRKTRSQSKTETNNEGQSQLDTEERNGTNQEVVDQTTESPPATSEPIEQQTHQQQWQPQPYYQEVLVVPPNRIIFAIPKWVVYIGTAVIGILFVALGGFVGDKIYKTYFLPGQMLPNMTFSAVGDEGWEFFKKYDRDGDLKLSLDEYETLYHTLIASGINVTTDLQYKADYTVGKEEQTITMQAFFQPLLLETMNTNLSDPSEQIDSLKGLQEWKTPNKETKDFGVTQFKGFLPPNNSFIEEPGKVYQIWNINSTSLPDIPSHRSSNKWLPPRVEDELVVIHQLLSMFHPRPFLRSRFPPQGGVASVRAYNKEYLDISFRLHAEFQLSEPPNNPMWFTPAQFTGNLIISRDYRKIIYFHMYVPTDKKLNVDMEWINDIETAAAMQVDIGFLPQMEMNMVSTTTDLDKTLKAIKWTNEIPEFDVKRKIEIKMYPFKEELEKDPHQPVYSKTASHFLQNYKFPVMMYLALKNGTIVHRVNANDFMHSPEGEYSVSMMDSFWQLFSGDEGLIPTRKVTTQRPELFREKRMEKRDEIPPEHTNEEKYLQFLKEGVRRAQNYL